MPDDFERMWADLAPVGRSAASGGYFRQPFTSSERELAAWFLEAAAARGLRVESDAFGNTVGWWEPDGAVVRDPVAPNSPDVGPERHGLSPPARVLTGSHLDSVLDGGAYDGPLGVVSALAAIDQLRDRGFVPSRPIGVGVFVEEEGSRFGLACLGSRLATGAITWETARELTDRDGVRLGDVVDADPPGQNRRVDLLADVGTFVELHVEQGRDLVDRNAAVGIASEIWPHGRYRFDFTGEANHAGSTRMADRKDPMLTYAMTALAANKQARLVDERATFGRVDVVPNGTNAVPSRVSAWLDARASSDEALTELVDVDHPPGERAGRARRDVPRGDRGVGVRLGDLRRNAGRSRRLAGDPHRGGPRRRDPVRRGHPDRDALRPQPDRRQPLAGGARRDPRLPGRRPRARGHPRAAGPMTSYLLERAWVDGSVQDDVLVEVEDGLITLVEPGGAGGTRLPGLTLPGLVNDHSHAFHRALRGRTQRDRGTFWTWREQMYAVAEWLEPPTYEVLARATFREMVAAGYTSVTEFHYLHHRPDGTPYDEPNAMREALERAAVAAGIRLTLLDTCYVSSGFGEPPVGVQARYSDGTSQAWAERAGDGPAAIHSVRAVPRDQLSVFRGRAPLHVHLSEQVAENEACIAAYGVTPTRLLHDEGLLGPATTVVHATHLTDDDIRLLGATRTTVCITPTTERDLADGIGPARRLQEAGCRLSIGSDSHAVVDPFEELRALELDERLATQERGHWTAGELLGIGTGGAAIEVGAAADLVTVDTETTRTAGTGADENTAVFAATSADVVQVVCDGRVVFTRGDEVGIGRELDAAIGALWPRP